ncbi:MAG: MATE family efflux transporter [Bacteroidota bacterium]
MGAKALTALSLMYLTWLLARQSELAVAAYGVAGRIETLLMIGVLATSTAVTPFIAQNKGAEKTSRIEQAIVFGGKSSTYLGVLLCLLLYLFIQPIASIFSDKDAVISYTANYFYIVSLSFVFYGLYIKAAAIFNGLKLTTNSLKISAVRSFAFTIPLTLIGSYWGVKGIFIGVALSNVFAGFFASYQIRNLERKEFENFSKKNIIRDYLDDFKWSVGKRKMDKALVKKYKKGKEPNDVLFWLSRPPSERLLALEQIRQSYNQWKIWYSIRISKSLSSC